MPRLIQKLAPPVKNSGSITEYPIFRPEVFE